MSYREALPSECPPDAAETISAERLVYRVVSTFPPSQEDFKSQRAMNPSAVFRGVSECQAMGLSVFSDSRDAEKLLKLPKMRGRLLARVRLVEGAGKIQQTSTPSHHTWWPLTDFDILAHCEAIAS
jgi:hypothetical protein